MYRYLCKSLYIDILVHMLQGPLTAIKGWTGRPTGTPVNGVKRWKFENGGLNNNPVLFAFWWYANIPVLLLVRKSSWQHYFWSVFHHHHHHPADILQTKLSFLFLSNSIYEPSELNSSAPQGLGVGTADCCTSKGTFQRSGAVCHVPWSTNKLGSRWGVESCQKWRWNRGCS